MKNTKATIVSLIGCILCSALTNTALANHRAGDFSLPEIMTAGDFNHDGNLDLAVNLLGFDNFAILNGDGNGGFTITKHCQAGIRVSTIFFHSTHSHYLCRAFSFLYSVCA